MTKLWDILTYGALKNRLPLDALARILDISAIPYALNQTHSPGYVKRHRLQQCHPLSSFTYAIFFLHTAPAFLTTKHRLLKKISAQYLRVMNKSLRKDIGDLMRLRRSIRIPAVGLTINRSWRTYSTHVATRHTIWSKARMPIVIKCLVSYKGICFIDWKQWT